MNLSFSSALRWIAHAVELQLFLTACSLPLLIFWGLPLSLATVIGNSVFTPILACFLLISSLLFITQLCGVPNYILIWLLDKLTAVWLWLLGLGSEQWLMYYAKPAWPFLFVAPLGALIMLYHKNRLRKSLRIGLLVSLLCITQMICNAFKPNQSIFTIPCGSHHLRAIHERNTTLVIDQNGALGRIKSIDSWIQFTLTPTIIKKTGKPTIDHLVLTAPGQRIFQATHNLVERKIVKVAHVPVWEGSLKKNAWRAFFKLKELAQKGDCTFLRIGAKDHKIMFNDTMYVTIKTTPEKLYKNGIMLPSLQAWYTVDNKEQRLI